MYVYFIKAWGECPLIKIGKANDPWKRIKTLQIGCPFELKLLGVVQCKSGLHAHQVEKAAHRLFSKQRRRGEWFRLSDAGMRAIESIIRKVGVTEESLLKTEAGMAALDRQFRECMEKAEMSELIPIPVAAEKYGLEVKRLRGYVWRNKLEDPIGSVVTDEVYDDRRLQKLARAANTSSAGPHG